MTGYGKAECSLPNKKVTIEIKSLNSKQVDTSTRLPAIYREKELEIRQMISKSLLRGKIECNFHYEIVEGAAAVINQNVVNTYLKQLKEIAIQNEIEAGDLLTSVLRLPDTVIADKVALEESEWKLVVKTLEKAIHEVNEFRNQEGKALEKDLKDSIQKILAIQKRIEPYADERIELIKKRILNNLGEIVKVEEIDKNRFEQELIHYAEKLDINEEQVRLKNHLDYFMEILSEGSPNGKKLGFISQEIGREINTLGSKANHSKIQKLVVEMKEELEKIKEQLLNVL